MTKHKLRYSIWSAKITWCDVCKQHFYDTENDEHILDEKKAETKVVGVEARVMQKIADITQITMWVDMIWNDIFDDDELPLTAAQMNVIGKYINDAKEKIRKQFSV